MTVPPSARRQFLLGLCTVGSGCTDRLRGNRDSTWTETESETPTRTATPSQTPTPRPPGVDGRWHQYRRTPAQTGHTPEGRAVETEVDVAWTFEADDRLTAEPVVADGVAYVSGDMAETYAVDVATGDPLWSDATRSNVGLAHHDGTLYAGSVPGEIIALDATDGTELWSTEVGDIFAGAPTVVGDAVFGTCRGTLVALDAATGAERWSFELGGEGEPSPAVVDGVVYVGDKEGVVHALDAADGTVRWQTDVGGRCHAGPGVAGDTVYVPTFLSVVALDRATGERRWSEAPRGSMLTPPVVTENVVVAGQFGKTALDAATGEEVWSFELEVASSRGTPASATGDTVYVGSPDDYVYGLDLATGEERFRYDVEGDANCAPVAVDGLLLVTDSAWQLVGLREVTAE